MGTTIKGVLLDLSGTVYQGESQLPGAAEALEELRDAGLPIRYLTNSSRASRRTILEKLLRMGIPIAPDELFTAPRAIRNYLNEHQLTPWLLCHPEIAGEFDIDPEATPNAVVVCDAAEAFDYANLNHAFRLLLDGACLISVGDNRYFMEEDGMSLDAGPFVRALEYATETEAISLGIPSAAFFHAAVAQFGCKASEVLMIGDDVYTDINGALRAGLRAALVQTGKYRPGDEQKILAPGACICADLLEAVRELQ